MRQVNIDADRLVRGVEVIDPDAIARDMATGSPGQAGREAVRQRRAAVGAGRPLVVETTLAGHGVLRLMAVARRAGYRIELHYVSVDSPEQALTRIRTRVAQGGHDVPEADVRRRFARSLAHLPAAIERSDEARLYDNADQEHPHREVANSQGRDVVDRRTSSGLGEGGGRTHGAAAPVMRARGHSTDPGIRHKRFVRRAGGGYCCHRM